MGISYHTLLSFSFDCIKDLWVISLLQPCIILNIYVWYLMLVKESFICSLFPLSFIALVLFFSNLFWNFIRLIGKKLTEAYQLVGVKFGNSNNFLSFSTVLSTIYIYWIMLHSSRSWRYLFFYLDRERYLSFSASLWF